MVIKYRGRRFKRSSTKTSGPVKVKPPVNDASLELEPSEQKPFNKGKLTRECIKTPRVKLFSFMEHLLVYSYHASFNYFIDALLTDELMKPPSPALFKTGLFSLPPAERPPVTSRGRPPSAKGRSRPTSHSSSHSPVRKVSKGGSVVETPVFMQEPFHKLQPLPAIGITRQEQVGDHSISDDSAIEMSSNYSSSLEATSSSHLLSANSFANIQHFHEPVRKSSQEEHALHRAFRVSEISETLPKKLSIDTKRKKSGLPLEEPSSDEPDCVVLAIKLPDGTRFERRFRQTDLLAEVMVVAQHHSPQPLPTCELSTNDVPKRVLTNYGMTLKQAGLTVRTILILSEL